jgi:ATP/ADP translocase
LLLSQEPDALQHLLCAGCRAIQFLTQLCVFCLELSRGTRRTVAAIPDFPKPGFGCKRTTTKSRESLANVSDEMLHLEKSRYLRSIAV